MTKVTARLVSVSTQKPRVIYFILLLVNNVNFFRQLLVIKSMLKEWVLVKKEAKHEF